MPNKQSPKETAEQRSAAIIEQAAMFSRLFNTSDGQKVLGHLNSKFLINSAGPGADHAFNAGSKEVMVYILEKIEQGKAHVHT